ncbi:hypothetical protein DPX16_7074 [Anabarilius grahami]|uniref:Uncharacterized protein n=1 Tax=Anabarilius grahami TaxID=495550 RepID=A0A3N0Y1X4_ANAGA|nr:hypothetical protein DPX16_7074 [Anabarilius grahami]
MGKRKDLSEFDKDQIVMARRLGQSISKTAALVGCSRSAVVRIYQKCSKEGAVVNRRQDHGRTRLIDARGERRLARVVRSNRRVPGAQIAQEVNAGSDRKGANVSVPWKDFAIEAALKMPDSLIQCPGYWTKKLLAPKQQNTSRATAFQICVSSLKHSYSFFDVASSGRRILTSATANRIISGSYSPKSKALLDVAFNIFTRETSLLRSLGHSKLALPLGILERPGKVGVSGCWLYSSCVPMYWCCNRAESLRELLEESSWKLA